MPEHGEARYGQSRQDDAQMRSLALTQSTLRWVCVGPSWRPDIHIHVPKRGTVINALGRPRLRNAIRQCPSGPLTPSSQALPGPTRKPKPERAALTLSLSKGPGLLPMLSHDLD
jgi:hypothetical protein